MSLAGTSLGTAIARAFTIRWAWNRTSKRLESPLICLQSFDTLMTTCFRSMATNAAPGPPKRIPG